MRTSNCSTAEDTKQDQVAIGSYHVDSSVLAHEVMVPTTSGVARSSAVEAFSLGEAAKTAVGRVIPSLSGDVGSSHLAIVRQSLQQKVFSEGVARQKVNKLCVSVQMENLPGLVC
jgi:hypothetical protein